MFNLDDFEISGGFKGPLKLMRKTVSLSEYKGIWRDLGSVKEFVPNKKKDEAPFKLYSWADDIHSTLIQYQAKDLIVRPTNQFDEDRSKAWKKTKWQTIENQKMGYDYDYEECSYPEYCISGLFDFMSDQLRFNRIGKGDTNEDAQKVLARASSIRLPRPDADKFNVVHQFGSDGEYLGFKVRPKGARIKKCNGVEVIDGWIDLSLPYRVGVCNDEDMDLAVSSLKREYDQEKPREWDKAGCEEFFNDRSNFI